MAYPGVVTQPGNPANGNDATTKPVPDRDDPLTKPFWDAANRGVLVVQRCQGCRTFYHPPVGMCWNCLGVDLEFEPVSGRGRVYSYAIVWDQRVPAFDALTPFAVASVALDEAPEITLPTNLPGTPIDQVRSGMAVTVEFEEIAPGVRIPQFRAVRGQ